MSKQIIPSLKEFAYARLSFVERGVIDGMREVLGKFRPAKKCSWCNRWGAKYPMESFSDWKRGCFMPPIICQNCFDEEIIMVPMPCHIFGPMSQPNEPLTKKLESEWYDRKHEWQLENGIEYIHANAYSNPDGATYIWRLFDEHSYGETMN